MIQLPKPCYLLFCMSSDMISNNLFRNADLLWTTKLLSKFSALPHKQWNWNESKHTAHESEHQIRHVVPNCVAKINSIESDCHRGFLPEEVEQLRYLRAFNAVAVNGICVRTCRHDLNAEDADEHARQRPGPMRLMCHGEAENQETGWDEDSAWPDSLQSYFGWWIAVVRASRLALEYTVHDSTRKEFAHDGADSHRTSICKTALESIPPVRFSENRCVGDCREYRGKAVLSCVVQGWEDDRWILRHAEARKNEMPSF